MQKVNIRSLLAKAGKHDPEPINIYGNAEVTITDEFHFPEGVNYDLVLWPGEAKIILMTGTIEYTWQADCDICLEHVTSVETVDITEDIYPPQYDPYESKKLDEKFQYDGVVEESEFLFHNGSKVDLSKFIQDIVSLNLPIVVRCSEDCPGLCVYCGKRDEENHDCVVENTVEETVSVRSEFDKLKDLL